MPTAQYALKLRWIGLSLAIAIASMSAGCKSGPRTSDTDLQTIDYARFVELRQASEQEPVVVIDVRPAEDYRRGHIPGAINIPLPNLDKRDPRLSAATRLIVYASGSSSPLSPAAAKKLIAIGYTGVYDFRGGTQLWRAKGGELVTEAGGK